MFRNEYRQEKTKYGLKKLAICISYVLYHQYMDLFSRFLHVFLILNYRSSDIGMFVLISSISVETSKINIWNK